LREKGTLYEHEAELHVCNSAYHLVWRQNDVAIIRRPILFSGKGLSESPLSSVRLLNLVRTGMRPIERIFINGHSHDAKVFLECRFSFSACGASISHAA